MNALLFCDVMLIRTYSDMKLLVQEASVRMMRETMSNQMNSEDQANPRRSLPFVTQQELVDKLAENVLISMEEKIVKTELKFGSTVFDPSAYNITKKR